MKEHDRFLAGIRASVSELMAEKSLRYVGNLHAESGNSESFGCIFRDEKHDANFCFLYIAREGEQNCYVSKGAGVVTAPPSPPWRPYRFFLFNLRSMTAEEKKDLATSLSKDYVRPDFDEAWKAIVDEIRDNYSLIIQRLQ